MPNLQIAAGGESSRIRPYMDSLGLPPNFPKHLLPLDDYGKTIIDFVIDDSRRSEALDSTTIHTNPVNNVFFVEHFYGVEDVEIKTVPDSPNSFYPFWQQLLEREETVVGSFGDFRASLDWDHIFFEHTQSEHPITFVAGKSHSIVDAPQFSVKEDKTITNFTRRASSPGEMSLVNVGAYIFDPSPRLLEIVSDYLPSGTAGNQDYFLKLLMRQGLIRAHVIELDPINVNDEQTYKRLVELGKVSIEAS